LKALIYGVKEYCEKLNFKKLLVGLSGGIDSALVTYIAVKAIGSENVQVLLMPSKYSSKGSVDDARKLIDNLGIKWKNVSIQPVFDSINKSMAPALGENPRDITEENIQARIRGIYLMAVSNNYNSLLLTTGNKSELAVGYCTLYGDMAGGLAVIADLYKTEVYELARFINNDTEIIPEEIINKPPSAELREGQKDQDSLPPYDFLDKILKMYLEENKEEREIVKLLGDKETIKKVLRLVDLNEFKRKQAAPALRVSRKAFGYGRRYPIVQGWRR
jgi:NAD+ synthetase